MRTLLLLITSFISFGSFAQVLLSEQEADISLKLDSLRNSRNDEEKMLLHESLRSSMQTALSDPTAFSYPFTLLRTMGIIDSPDGMIRIVTWNVEMSDQKQIYGGFILKKDEKKPDHKLIELVDNSYMLEYKTEESLEASNWYGALYYKIIPVEKSNKTYYTLLGWDGNTEISNIKLIDVLYFTGNVAKLGYPLFKTGDKTKKRIYMEHSEQTVMSLKWDESVNRIMFDHLSPETSVLEGFYQYYVPDMSYDAFEFQGNKWVLIEDVIGVNKDKKNITLSKIDSETGEIEETVVKNEWVDPTSSSAPGAKETHIAVKPGEESGVDKKDPKADTKKPVDAMTIYDNKKHKDKRDPSSRYSGNKPRKKGNK